MMLLDLLLIGIIILFNHNKLTLIELCMFLPTTLILSYIVPVISTILYLTIIYFNFRELGVIKLWR
jgi:hypothetical protein